MSPSVATRTWGRPPPVDLARRRSLLIFLVVAALVALAVLPRLALPAKTPALTITNGTEYTVMIEAARPDGGGWTPVALVDANRTVQAQELVDRGSTWNLRFTSQGREVSGYQVERAELAANGWQYAVPADVALQLRTQGAPPTP